MLAGASNDMFVISCSDTMGRTRHFDDFGKALPSISTATTSSRHKK